MSEQKKENDLLYIDHRGELLIWLIIILFIVVIFFVIRITKPHKANDYSLFIPDVDGLIVGSPVRMMGIEVGFVTEIKPLKDEVFVKFIIKNKSIKIPHGTEATVEFSGMAGSKSLELYLPDENTYIDNNTPIISVEPPKRLSDAYGLLNEMFKTIGSIIATVSHFGKHLSEIEAPTMGNPQDFGDFIKFSNNAIDIQQQRVDELGRKLDARRKQKSENNN